MWHIICKVGTKSSKFTPITLFWTTRSTECILANFSLQYLSNNHPHPAQLKQYNWDRHSLSIGLNCYLVDKSVLTNTQTNHYTHWKVIYPADKRKSTFPTTRARCLLRTKLWFWLLVSKRKHLLNEWYRFLYSAFTKLNVLHNKNYGMRSDISIYINIIGNLIGIDIDIPKLTSCYIGS